MTHEQHIKQVKDYYEKFPSKSMRLMGSLSEFRLNVVKKNIKTGYEVLDAGCGNGAYAVELPRDCNITGVDITNNLLREFEEEIREKNLTNIKLINADLRRIPVQSGRFDLVFSFSTLYYVSDLGEVLGEFGRILKPGGTLIFDILNEKSLGALIYGKLYAHKVPQSFWSIPRLRGMIRDSGFAMENEYNFELVPRLRHLQGLLDLKASGRTLDETISSMPLLRNCAFRKIIVCKKVG